MLCGAGLQDPLWSSIDFRASWAYTGRAVAPGTTAGARQRKFRGSVDSDGLYALEQIRASQAYGARLFVCFAVNRVCRRPDNDAEHAVRIQRPPGWGPSSFRVGAYVRRSAVS